MGSGQVEESIKYSITKNGFPQKKVKLPFKPVFDSCKQNNTSLAEVLDNLAKENITGKIKGDHIEFKSSIETEHESSNTAQAKEWRGPGSADLNTLQQSAMEMLSRMTPEQIANLQKMAQGLNDEEKKSLLEMMTGQNKPPS
jgi:hypothetical protein